MKTFGLTKEQVKESREKYGSNSITEHKTVGFMDKLKSNLQDPMIKILFVALVINVIFTLLGKSEWYESAGIALAITLATLVSTFSEYRNENAFQRLQEEASQIKCKVYRDGLVKEIIIDDIVVGDNVLLQLGDKVPADGIVIDGSIKVDQSTLNGEAKEAPKESASPEYNNEDTKDFLDLHKVFRGSVVCGGNAVIRVTTVGDKTVYGEIAKELQIEDDRDTPLKVKLEKLAGSISKFGYIGGVLIALAFILQRVVIHNNFDIVAITAYCTDWLSLLNTLVEAVILAVIIIVMAVPEGLPLMIAIVSALNMGKMLKDNVLVRTISGIETAGSLNILFSDKTGTITKGKLEVVTFVDGSGTNYNTYDDIGSGLRKLVSQSIHYNTSAVMSGDKVVGGNMTERALMQFAENEVSDIEVVTSIPFNSADKYSASSIKGPANLTLIKGAPEKILNKCSYYRDNLGNRKDLLTTLVIEDEINKLAGRAIRVLALATSDNPIIDGKIVDEDWTLIGIVGIRDEIRPESVTAIAEVQEAGVQVVMITGDRKDTAVAIATEAGLIKNPSNLVYTSDEIALISDEALKDLLPRIRVIARALPSDKSRLVRLAQELNLVVGMTGDGVNDSPALKKADVGFAMGGGTEVAKEASDIVILDDNFSSIEKAILYGRTIFNSIRKFIIFQLSVNVSAVSISFVAPLVGVENPISITQILWVNLVMDTLAALAFGGEPALKEFMKEKPKRRDESIVSSNMWSQILIGSGAIFVISAIMLFTTHLTSYFRADADNKYMTTAYFTFFIMAAVFNAFNARTNKFNLFNNISHNKGFLQVMATIVLIQALMTSFGGVIMGCYGLTGSEWINVIALAFLVIPIDLVRKSLMNSKKEA